jgi:PhnB protein
MATKKAAKGKAKAAAKPMKKAPVKAAAKKSPVKSAAKKTAKKTAPVKKAAPAKKNKVSPIPKGYHSLTPYLIVRNAAEALGFYVKAFGAKEKVRMAMPDGSVMHAEIQIGDSMLMLTEENPSCAAQSPLSLGGNATHVLIYTKDAEGLVARAEAAGCTVEMPVTPMFWGDRYGKVRDPYGHSWSIATHFEEVTPKQMQKRADAFMAEMAQQGQEQPH